MIRKNIEVEICCKECGKNLSDYLNVEINKNDNIKISIDPCSKCMEDAEGNGYDKGYNDGKDVIEKGY